MVAGLEVSYRVKFAICVVVNLVGVIALITTTG